MNPLDINHIENSQCRLGWWYAYIAQVCTWRLFTSRVLIFFLILTQIYRLGVMKETDVLPRKKGKKRWNTTMPKETKFYWQYITRTPCRHCFKAENFMCQPPTKKSRVFGYRNYSGLIFVGWLNGLIIVSITNVPPSRHVSSRRYKHI